MSTSSLSAIHIPPSIPTASYLGYNGENFQQLEYLDLSASDEEDYASQINQKNTLDSGVRLADAEFYSFDDYELIDSTATVNEISYIDEDDDDLQQGTYVRLEELYPLPDDQVFVDNPRSKPMRSILRHSHSQPQFRLGKENDYLTAPKADMKTPIDVMSWTLENINMKRHISRNSSTGSSSSTATTSSSASVPSSASSRPPPPLAKHLHNNIKNINIREKLPNKRKLNSSLSAVIPGHPLHAPLSRRSFSSNSFRHQSGIAIMSEMDQPTTKVSSRSDGITCSRTEELLNGIVKLAEDDVLVKSKPQAPSTSILRKQSTKKKTPLHTSKSSPLIHGQSFDSSKVIQNSQSKPASPVSGSTASTRKFTFSRKGSFSSQHSSDEKRSDKKSKSCDKLNQVDPTAFIDAVEHFDIDMVAYLMSTDNSCINKVNEEGLTALDIAMLTNHVPMIKILLKYGARARVLAEGDENDLCKKLQVWIRSAEQNVKSLRISSASGNNSKENEKRLNQWEYKHRLFRRMKTGYEQAGLPGQPQNVKLSVTSDSSLSVQFDAPENINAAVTRYKVQWSCAQNFKPLVGEVFINDLQNLKYDITGLECGCPYYVRVTAWNMKGFGKASCSDPPYAIPSSWRDVEGMQTRSNSYNIHKVNDVIANMRKQKTMTTENSDSSSSHQSTESPPYQRKASTSVPLMRGLKGLFSSAFKFQKSIKRGLYLALVCYNEDKVLVTTEDNLPIVEVDESYNGSTLQSDHDWLMKVLSSSMDIVRQLKQDMERLPENSTAQLRNQLLSAILQIQDTMGTTELGQLFYKPIDGSGSTIFVIVSQLADSKQSTSISSAVKWQARSKLSKNTSQTDVLLPLLNEIIFYHGKCTKPLSRGLYLGYLHIKFNVEVVRVLTPETRPSVLPYIKIRECPNVSKPEWQALLSLNNQIDTSSREAPDITAFKKQLMKSAKKLADKLGMSPEQIANHRFYDVEVLDFSKDVSFILLVPPRDLVCSVHSSTSNQGSSESIEMSREYMDIPVKVFENIHLQTYQPHFIQSFCRAASTVDTQLILTQQLHREAFHNEEIEQTKKQVETVKEQHQQLEEMWRCTRWLTDVIAFARDKAVQGIILTQLHNSIVEQSTLTTKCDNFGRSSDDGYHSDKISVGGSTTSDKQSYKNTNNNNGQYYDGEHDYHHNPSSEDGEQSQLEPDIIRVYAAYNSGLTKGTSVMLHITPKTTAREVVNLVVMQLNQAVARKGLTVPIYNKDQLMDFCLVAVIGPRERVLRDDYKLLQLQNPWTKGCLFVRLKSNLLAALEHGETTEV